MARPRPGTSNGLSTNGKCKGLSTRNEHLTDRGKRCMNAHAATPPRQKPTTATGRTGSACSSSSRKASKDEGKGDSAAVPRPGQSRIPQRWETRNSSGSQARTVAAVVFQPGRNKIGSPVPDHWMFAPTNRMLTQPKRRRSKERLQPCLYSVVVLSVPHDKRYA